MKANIFWHIVGFTGLGLCFWGLFTMFTAGAACFFGGVALAALGAYKIA